MRNNVIFRYPTANSAKAVVENNDDDDEDEADILLTEDALWFVELLQRIPEIEVNSDLFQEDWGVVVVVVYDQKRFWIGLNKWLEEDHDWWVHLHHGSFAWLQKFSAAGKDRLNRLIQQLYRVLNEEPKVSHMLWHGDDERGLEIGAGSPTP